MTINLQEKNSTYDFNSISMATSNENSIEYLKIKPIDTKFYRNYFLLVQDLKKFKNKNVLDFCPLFDLFGNTSKVLYERYDCIDINNIKINSNKIFVNINCDKNIPTDFIEDMVNNIKLNSYPNSLLHTRITEIKGLVKPDVEIIYSIGDKISIFDEAELIDIYHSLSVLSINENLKEKVKNMIIRGENSF